MKKLTLLLLFITRILLSISQELPLQQYYLLNPFLLNPSTAGFSDQIEIRASFAQHWIGIANAPTTSTLSAHTNLGKGIGLGGYFFNDVNGLNKETGINLACAYHIKLGDDNKFLRIRQLSFGIGITGFQHHIILTDFTPHDHDPAVDGATKSGSSIEFNTGIITRYDRFFAGISVARLGAGRLSVYDDATEPKIPTYIGLNCGYDFSVFEKIIFEPSILYKFNTDKYKQADLNLKVMLIPADELQTWLTLSLRNGFFGHKSAMSNLIVLIGVKYRSLLINYAYDLGLTELAKSNSGSHQLMVGLHLQKSKKHKVNCPVF